MDIVYVLNETEEDGSAVTIGVFDSPDIGVEKLKEYYGNEITVVEYLDIRDSGIEWQKRIMVDSDIAILTLHYFELNEI